MSESWREIVIQKIWGQWVSIGGSGAGKPRPYQEPVDPEALVLVTTSLGMEEPRLAEMCFDWLSTHESGHASAIARDTFWLPKTVQNILNEWENAGIVSVQAKQREKVFRLDASKWEFLIRGSSENISWNHSASYF